MTINDGKEEIVMNDEEQTVTDPRMDRAWLSCKCHRCGIIAQCTPRFDFYEPVSEPGTLICERCMTVEIHSARK